MATWTNIQTTRLEPGKPIRSIDGIALRDNPIAIAEGAAGAPRIQTNAIANNAVTTAKIANNSVTTAKILNSNVTNAKLANNAVTGSKIAGGAVTVSKLATGGGENGWVLDRYGAGATANRIGTYAQVGKNTSGAIAFGATIAGSQLRLANSDGISTNSLPGTWRVMSSSLGAASGQTAEGIGIVVRIS